MFSAKFIKSRVKLHVKSDAFEGEFACDTSQMVSLNLISLSRDTYKNYLISQILQKCRRHEILSGVTNLCRLIYLI